MCLDSKFAIIKAGKTQRQVSIEARMAEGRLSDLVTGYHSAMLRRIVVVAVCTIAGAILGPILGMTLMERMYGVQDAQGPGFVGFVHGLWVGPIVGFLIGIAFRRPPPDPGR